MYLHITHLSYTKSYAFDAEPNTRNELLLERELVYDLLVQISVIK
jgi:hypothetical protein